MVCVAGKGQSHMRRGHIPEAGANCACGRGIYLLVFFSLGHVVGVPGGHQRGGGKRAAAHRDLGPVAHEVQSHREQSRVRKGHIPEVGAIAREEGAYTCWTGPSGLSGTASLSSPGIPAKVPLHEAWVGNPSHTSCE
eukprot:1194991-Prorocentrum_minimum.AAC.2